MIAPFFADQTTNAALIEAVGAGIALIPGTDSVEVNVQALKRSMKSLRSAVGTVLTTPSFRECAQSIARELRDADSYSAICGQLSASL